MTNKISAALALAAKGFKVFPLAEGVKFPPLIKNWPQRATSDQAEIQSWWTKWPNANVAIHTAGFVVLDVDVRNGGDDSFDKLDMVHGLPDTLTTRTPTDGRHVFYRLPEGHPGVTNGANKLGSGIDVKSTNGYVVAPGSVVEAGRYRFVCDLHIADAPEWLVQELGTFTAREQKPSVDVQDAPLDVVRRAYQWLIEQPAGDGAYKTACGLRDFGLSLNQTLQFLLAHDGRPVSVIRPKVEHAYRYAQNAPGTKAASAEDFPIVENVNPQLSKKARIKPRRLTEIAKLSTGRTGYLVKGLLQRRSHAVMYGAPGEGKTFVALDVAYHVAAGREWHGHKVHQGPVLYLAYEGVGGMAKRAAALLRHYGDEDVPLYVQGADYNLRDMEGRQALAEDMAALPEKPALIVIDTLARAMKGGDENSAQDMGALNDAVSALIEATGACVVLVHHSGKNKAGGARGSSALLGAIDTELEVDSRQVFSRKQRDIELADPIGFKLVPVMVGVDEDGEDITSCVVEPSTASAEIASAASSLRGNSKRAFETLCEMALDNEPVRQDDWRRACHEFLPKGESAASKTMYDVRTALKRAGVIEIVDGLVRRKLE